MPYRLLLAAIIIFCTTIAAGAGELRGLVIGIDKYPRLDAAAQLEGAVADANDIAQALARAGARDVTLITDLAASRAAILTAWQALLERSREGDTIVFSYAGHGSQEPEPAGRHEEADGKNENFILSPFDLKGHSDERIVDDEMFTMLKEADDRGINVVLVADSCHSGTMYRSVDGRVAYRKLDLPDIAPAELALPENVAVVEDPAAFKHVTFVSGTEDSRIVPEVPINGQKRGALSFSFARAIEGEADRDGDGRTSQAELVGFLVPKVNELAEGQQTPQILPTRAGSNAIVPGRQVGTVATAPKDGDDLLRLAVVGGGAETLNGLPGVALVDRDRADITFDLARRRVDHAVGGMVAQDIDERSVVTVIAKFAAIKWLTRHATGAPAQFTLRSGQQRYRIGKKIDLTLTAAERPFITLFNLAPDGRVEFFVRDDEVQQNWLGKTAEWRFQPDKPPFGAEHMFAILTDRPMTSLHGKLKAMSSADRMIGLRQVLQDELGAATFQLGSVGIYTGDEK